MSCCDGLGGLGPFREGLGVIVIVKHAKIMHFYRLLSSWSVGGAHDSKVLVREVRDVFKTRSRPEDTSKALSVHRGSFSTRILGHARHPLRQHVGAPRWTLTVNDDTTTRQMDFNGTAA